MLFDCNLNLADGVGNVVAVQNIQINIDIDGVVAFNVSVDVVVFDDTRLVWVFPRSSAPSISAAARDAMSAMISAYTSVFDFTDLILPYYPPNYGYYSIFFRLIQAIIPVPRHILSVLTDDYVVCGVARFIGHDAENLSDFLRFQIVVGDDHRAVLVGKSYDYVAKSARLNKSFQQKFVFHLRAYALFLRFCRRFADALALSDEIIASR